jgi:nitrogen fixation/metabolism regulation signal transduction histidine kinase
VLVLDELTEMLRAQKSAAWQEVARRIAHEIKNPLTPIQLSSQRLSRFLERRDASESKAPKDVELTKLVHECSRLIEREVATLAALVNEFSQFVRFPTAFWRRQTPTTSCTRLWKFPGVSTASRRLLWAKTSRQFARMALLRSVVVNLIDNAAEALENASFGNPYLPCAGRLRNCRDLCL